MVININTSTINRGERTRPNKYDLTINDFE